MADWDYFDKFNEIDEKYLPSMGEGDSIATQAVTAVNKLVYKWYNDGDVYDNRYYMSGWCNDLSSYANWLHKYTPAGNILDRIGDTTNSDDYEDILVDLADMILDEEWLKEWDKVEKAESIYNCDGPFAFEEYDEEDEDDDDWLDEDEDDEEDW